MMKFIDLETQQKRIRAALDHKIANVLDHQKFIMGDEVLELEQCLADYAGVKHCISCASGSDALMIAIMALEIGPGDEVITSPFSFFASSEMIALLGATPVYVDIDPFTYNINAELIESAITENTKAIMPVSIFGQCADMNKINEIARRHELPVVEDAAQSFGATYHGRRSCSLSEIGCTSFFPSKPLGCYGDGGACFTNDDNLAALMRQIRVHGQVERYQHSRLGITGRLDTLQAAVLLCKLDIFEDEIHKRQKVAQYYQQQLSKIGGVSIYHAQDHVDNAVLYYPYVPSENTCVYAQYTLQLDHREAICKSLKQQNIPTAVHYPIPLYQQPALQSCSRKYGETPVCDVVSQRVVSLPMHPYLAESEIDQVVEALSFTIKAC